ncbi:MAG: TRASH domain-containing protein [Ferroplasma sp.]|uniref:TRASH domain-containing protein n=1 Tax=Ferroplasma sp. TaxID=2591003 RepID=UPI002816713E|nr:TRASH domain-containing protein [Ferroplasma sp.]WMT52184.1 MAG: TRASH domain-containing protein [Ferroplasma sp.]
MQDKITYNESKVLRLLMNDSRMSVLDISRKLGLNRNTVSNIIKKLNSSIIERYTLETKEPEDSLYIIMETDDINSVDSDKVIEYFELANGHYTVIMNREAIGAGISYNRVDLAHRRVINKIPPTIDLYCDYCGGIIAGKPMKYDTLEGTLYFCCNTCRDDYINSENTEKHVKK